ncbi:hypothetical protein CMV_027126 [Castanea mollissima]|uniref:SWIM-type domain-containing protein n=1 Tax=Castanea mollissima TaxID=60419 RepID=A0A8J4V9Q0_9ROSI|nr:hypothetical protein CMV_027126 [Castanea mollissima]
MSEYQRSYMEEENNDDSQKLDTDYIPKLGIEFGSEQEAYDFYNECGRNYGFSIRKEWCNKRKKDGVVTSRKFTCCKEGNKAPWERDGENKYERAETRTGCNAHMIIRLDKKKGKYFIHSLELNHNHILHIPQCAHMMPSQRKVSKAQAMEIDLAYDSGIKLKDSYEFMARQVGGRDALGYTKQDQKNYHYSKRQKEQKCDYDIVKFFIHFERLLDAKRYKELKGEYNLRQKLPKVKIASPMLIQAAHIYTPKLFLKFQEQYEEFQGAFVKERVERNASHEYIVSIYGKPKDRRVIWNPFEKIVSCSCRKFERGGILCSHALKILDVMDIKVLPEKYILKRWTKDAKNEIVQDFNGRDIKSDTKLEVTTRYKFLGPMYVKLIARASECEEAYELALGSYNELSKKIDDILRKKSNPCQVDINQENSSDEMTTISAKGLKKKQGCKGRRRIKSCLEKPKKKKKGSIHQPIQTNQCLQDKHLTSSMQVNGAISYNPLPYIDHSVQDLYIPHFSSVGEPCNPSSLSQGKRIRNDQEQSSFGTFENSVNFYVAMCQARMTNPHVPLPCYKNPSDLEGDDISSLLTKFTTGKIEAFST